jgi:DNA-directed RNA polymerase specialized sigma24 family protein
MTAALEMDELLSLVSDKDQEVLRLAAIDGLRGKSLANRLQISEGAAYTRLNRALTRLAQAYSRSELGR